VGFDGIGERDFSGSNRRGNVMEERPTGDEVMFCPQCGERYTNRASLQLTRCAYCECNLVDYARYQEIVEQMRKADKGVQNDSDDD